LGDGLKNASVDAIRLKGETAAMEQVIYRGWKIRTISVVDGNKFAGAAHFGEPEAAWGERRRYAFSRMGNHHSPVDAEFRAMSWAKLWIKSREAPEVILA